MVLGPNGVYYSQYDDIEEVNQMNPNIEPIKNSEKIGKHFQTTIFHPL